MSSNPVFFQKRKSNANMDQSVSRSDLDDDISPDSTPNPYSVTRRKNNSSTSSIDTDYLLDHRRSSFQTGSQSARADTFPNNTTATAAATAAASTTDKDNGLFKPRQRRNSILSATHADLLARKRRSQSFSSPSHIEKSIAANSKKGNGIASNGPAAIASSYGGLNVSIASSSRTPLLAGGQPNSMKIMPSYDSLDYRDHRSSLHKDILSIDIENIHPPHGSLVLDEEDYHSLLGSKPASRRSSSASSLNDVCLPIDSPDNMTTSSRVGCLFDLSYLEEFAALERKDSDTKTHTVNEIYEEAGNGRLRPQRYAPPWNGNGNGIPNVQKMPGKVKDLFQDSSMRFTYFREDLEATVHSPNISGLLRPGQSFDDLFNSNSYGNSVAQTPPMEGETMSRESSAQEDPLAPNVSGTSSPFPQNLQGPSRPQSIPDISPFWLDVLNPTEEEMKVLSKSFGIHPLTTEDIFLGETREKVEIFRNYYLVCFRSFDVNDERQKRRDQSIYAEDRGARRKEFGGSSNGKRRKGKKSSSELTPLNMYIIVFHEGVITFHFAATHHPMNVRRRARLLRDYITVSSDWISYALIDDITDGFAPMIDAIDEEVTLIEDHILKMHSGETDSESDDSSDEDAPSLAPPISRLSRRSSRVKSTTSSSRSAYSNSSVSTRDEKWREKGDMLRRIGECRKRIMSILRLLGSKADVIKGFSKRCTEQWEVTPRSEIGLYLGDIQDHIVTMVQSLNHYEKLLSRAHSNYLAQLNIDMTRVNNDMNDVLGKITVLGTIVLPMNIVTGLWGMNVLVPGQDSDTGLVWFWGITMSLFVFAALCFVIARRVYHIA